MKKTLFLIHALLATTLFIQAQDENNYRTPWYGVIGLRSNSVKYVNSLTSVKSSLVYGEISDVNFANKTFLDVGIPFGGYLLRLLITRKVGTDYTKSEVPFLYIKGGYDIVKAGKVKIGLGASASSVWMQNLPTEMEGYSKLKYGAVSPLVYAKINLGKFLVTPVFEYNVVSWTDNSKIKRTGFSMGSYLVVPISGKFAININPYYERGKFKSSSENILNVTSSNLACKIGLVVNFD